MAREFIYHMKGLTKTYTGGKKILDNVNLSFYPEAKIGVLGINGSGKSTLLKIMAGIDTEWTGEGFVAQGARVGYLPQEPQLDPNKSVRENVMEGVAEKQALLDRYNELAMNYSEETADEMTALQDQIEAKDLWELDSKVDQAMEALGCPSDEQPVATLSGGERRRVALCKLLLWEPELLLLDEPTNHLDAETVNWLEGHLKQYPGAILIVTHDRYFLDNVTGWILELDRTRGYPYEGNYSAWLIQKQKRLAQEGREDMARQRAINREQEWISASPKARQSKSKARITRYEELVAKSQDKIDASAQIVIPIDERLGNNVIEFEHLNKAFGDRLLIEDLSFKLPPGGIVGVIGAERRRQDHVVQDDHRPGEARRRHHLRRRDRASRLCRPVARRPRSRRHGLAGSLGRQRHHLFQQARDQFPRLLRGLRPSRAPTSRRRSAHCRAASATACIWPARSRAAPMCCCSTSPPTISTWRPCGRSKRRWKDYAGCAVIISHDRWFLNRIATHILAFEGESHVEWFEGNFSDYEEDKKRRLGADSLMPKKIKYKKFSR